MALETCKMWILLFLPLGPFLEESRTVLEIPIRLKNDLAVHLCGKLSNF